MMDVLIPYKASRTDELRFALRSLKNIEHGKVFIVGDLPAWATNVIHIPRDNARNRYKDVSSMVEKSCRDSRLSEDFILFNDDFFVMSPMEELPKWYKGSLKEDYIKHAKRQPHAMYTRAISMTDRFLKARGIKYPKAYNCHIPVVMNKKKRLEVADMIRNSMRYNNIVLPRVVYSNLFDDTGIQHPDCKYIGLDDNYPRYEILSTHDGSFTNGKIGQHIRETFPEMSPYELYDVIDELVS